MQDLDRILANLENAPDVLENLVKDVPPELLKAHRKPGKWCIHSHACHIVVAQPMLLERLRRFQTEAEPEFIPYNPDKDVGESALLAMDLGEQLAKFRSLRGELLDRTSAMDDSFWGRRARHPEYALYTPYIMLRHIMMHDYLHMYRIEELWLTRPDYL